MALLGFSQHGFTAKLIDVHPRNADFPGDVDHNIADSIFRALYRNDLSKAELLQPLRPYEFPPPDGPDRNLMSLAFGADH